MKHLSEKSDSLKLFQRLTEGTSQKRIARYNEFDNGHVLYSWSKMTDEEAEQKAKEASEKDDWDIYYVAYDDIMNPSSELRWYRGNSYTSEEARAKLLRDKEENWEKQKNELLSKIFARYSDISEEDEDYLNSLDLLSLKDEIKNRGWTDILE